MDQEKENLILKMSFEFSLKVIQYVEQLEAERKYVIGNQLLKSGTSIGANVREAQHAESKRDFLHKLKIAMKEVEETEYWLDLCQHAEHYPNPKGLPEALQSLKRVLSKIIGSLVQRYAELQRKSSH